MHFYIWLKELRSLGFIDKSINTLNSSDFKYVYQWKNSGKIEEIQIAQIGYVYQIYRKVDVGHYRITFKSSNNEEILEQIRKEIKIIKLKTIISDDVV